MFKIVKRKDLATNVHLFEIEAPLVSRKAKAGQFIILRVDEKGERIPLTICDFDAKKGTVTLVFQEMGTTTKKLAALKEGDSISDFLGPLGLPSEVEKFGKVVLVGGGVGVAEVLPQAKALKRAGNHVITIIGARTKELLIFENELRDSSDDIFVATDDGSYCEKGFVTDILKKVLVNEKIDRVIAIGPLVMMKAVSEVAKQKGVKTIVSLNTIMVDGTGMCASCRVTVGGTFKFVCVDGPDFDAAEIDFNELLFREKRFKEEEKASLEKYESNCKKGCYA